MGSRNQSERFFIYAVGEIKYFGIKYLQDEDYQCGLGFGGCNRRPSWCDIAKIYPGDPGTARKVYFASKMQNPVNLIIKVIYVSTKHKLSLTSKDRTHPNPP